MTDPIKTKVVEIIAHQALREVSDIPMEASLTDIGIDSMGVVEAIFAIEEAFDVSVPFNANAPDVSAFDLSTVASTVEAVRGLVDSQSR